MTDFKTVKKWWCPKCGVRYRLGDPPKQPALDNFCGVRICEVPGCDVRYEERSTAEKYACVLYKVEGKQ